ncbi:MAG: hypothetical protein HC837_10280 [Chloroflexaceae bacterium]|nr:hypothetical protein [Chloroflexaceae bacterium]
MKWLLVLIMLVLATGLLPQEGAAGYAATMWPAEANPINPDALLVIRIGVTTLAEVRQLSTADLDLLSRDGNELIALVTPAQHAALQAAGWSVRIDQEQTRQLQALNLQTFQGGYHTVEEVEQFLRTMAARYPDLVTLVDIGDSWQKVASLGLGGYDLLGLRLTNKTTPGPKPVFFLMATIHAREIATTEIAMRFIEHLLTGYAIDPNVTWWLNEYEIVVLPMVNPDGHKIAEQGFYQRKNANPSNGVDGCQSPPISPFSNQSGVDLNRNFALAWGTVVGPETSPCSAVYPGPSAASESETQAVQQFVRSLYPAGRSPTLVSPAADDTTGILITLHSYANMVLWPWGYSANAPPNSAGLRRLGEQFASFNGYAAGQSSRSLYYSSGTTDDWSYGELGIPSYTFEIGPSGGLCGGFMPPYSCLDGGNGGDFWAKNLPALRYAAQVVRAPYQQPFGPHIRSVELVSDTASIDLQVELIPATDDPSVTIDQVEVYLDASPWHGGTPIALEVDNQGGNTWQTVLTRSQVSTGDDERQLLLARGRDTTGTWGPITATWLPLPASLPQPVWLPMVLRR